MLQFTIRPDGGSPSVYSMNGMLRQLSAEIGGRELLEIIGKALRSQQVPVKLTDGTRAILEAGQGEPQPPLPFQEILPPGPALSGPGRQQEFEASLTLLFPIDVRINCLATDRLVAQEIIENVLNGLRRPDPSFRIWFDADQIMEKMQGIPDHEGFAVHDVTEARKLLPATTTVS